MSNIASHAILFFALATLLSGVLLWLSRRFGLDEPPRSSSRSIEELRR